MIQVSATCRNEKAVEMNPARLTTGKVYIDYDRIVERVEAWLDARKPRIPDCDGKQVKARIAQRIVEISSEEYTQQAAAHVDESGLPLPPTSHFIVAGGLKICSQTGAVSVSPLQWLRHISLFVVVWLHMLAFLFIAIFRRSPADSVPATLLMEAGGGYEECDDRFIRYCKEGPLAPLSSARWIIVRAPHVPRKPTDPSFNYVTQPLIHLATTHLKRLHRICLLSHHLLAPIAFLRALLACPVSVLLARDIAYVPMVRWLDKKALIEAIVVTTSSFSSQPLWMKGMSDQRFKLHMVWYSQNFIPKVYVGEQERSSLPPARHMRVDVHWVWTEGFKSYLESLGQTSQIHVVGPILWYLPETIPDLGKAPIKIAIFDVTPLPNGTQAFGSIKNYYSVRTIQQFIIDIVELCKHIENVSGKEVLILLKHKRKAKVGRHDSQYLEFIEQMEALNPNFKLIDHQTNLFGLLEKCDVSISVPYTSTAYVASKLEKHAIYYDPFSELVPEYEKNTFVHFSSGQRELRRLIELYLNIA